MDISNAIPTGVGSYMHTSSQDDFVLLFKHFDTLTTSSLILSVD